MHSAPHKKSEDALGSGTDVVEKIMSSSSRTLSCGMPGAVKLSVAFLPANAEMSPADTVLVRKCLDRNHRDGLAVDCDNRGCQQPRHIRDYRLRACRNKSRQLLHFFRRRWESELLCSGPRLEVLA